MKKTPEQSAAALNTAKECEQYIRNVEQQAPPDAQQRIALAERRAIALAAQDHGASSPAEFELWEALVAKERILGPRNRTRQAIRRKGIIAAVDQAVSNSSPGALDQFRRIVAAGLRKYTFEQTILRHPQQFSAKATAQARRNLDLVDLSNEENE